MSFVESIRLNFRNKIYIPLTCKRRGKKLKNKNFTIISNNCWGGTVYEAYNLPKGSPTVGLFFMAKDYIEFLSDLKGYLEGSLTFIKPEESRWKDYVEVGGDDRFGTYPIGLLSNGKKTVEVFFLHYHDEKEAYDKWTRRIGRVNWERLLVKFNDQNGCTEVEVKKFMSLPFKNKLFFTCKHWPDKAKEQIVIKQFPKHNFILASYEPFGKSKYIDITEVLNSL